MALSKRRWGEYLSRPPKSTIKIMISINQMVWFLNCFPVSGLRPDGQWFTEGESTRSQPEGHYAGADAQPAAHVASHSLMVTQADHA